MLSELESPQLLVPDFLQLFLVKLLSFQLSDWKSPALLFIVSHYLLKSGLYLLPSLDMVAVSRAPSPESNPNSPFVDDLYCFIAFYLLNVIPNTCLFTILHNLSLVIHQRKG